MDEFPVNISVSFSDFLSLVALISKVIYLSMAVHEVTGDRNISEV